jgi:competence protein ComEC
VDHDASLGNASISFVDVGQGDCVVMVDGAFGDAVMVDCPTGHHDDALQAMDAESVRMIKAAIVTHSDLDHIGGIVPVVTSIPTERVLVNGAAVVSADPDERKKLRAVLRSIASLPYSGIAVEPIETGCTGALGENITWQVIAPSHAQLLHAQGIGDPNHASVVTNVSACGWHFTLCGDAGALSLLPLIDQGVLKESDVLLVPHHGGAMTQVGGRGFAEILSAIAPSHCVLSVGVGNQYGHPSPATLTALKDSSLDPTIHATEWDPDWTVFLGSSAPQDVGTVRFVCGDVLGVSVY